MTYDCTDLKNAIREALPGRVQAYPLQAGFNQVTLDQGELDYLKTNELGIGNALAIILEYVCYDGSKLAVGYHPPSTKYYVTLREDTINYKTARALTCWSEDPVFALRGLALALTTQYPHFPD